MHRHSGMAPRQQRLCAGTRQQRQQSQRASRRQAGRRSRRREQRQQERRCQPGAGSRSASASHAGTADSHSF
jgi:hypothetical protein